MSGAFPISTAAFRVATIKSNQKTLISKSASGKKFSRQLDGQKFAFTADIITGKRSDIYGELMAFIIKQRSGKENFTIVPPEISSTRGNETGTILVNGSHNAGDTTIDIDGNALADDEAVTYNNVPFTVYLINDMQEFGQVGADKDGNVLYKFELDVEEAL